MKRKLLLLTMISGLLVSQLVFAIRISDLYQTVVPVTDESTAQRNTAIRQAFIQVLIKLTGDRNIQQGAGIESLLEHPGNFVQQYRYSRVTDEEESTSPLFELQVRFDEAALNETLRSYGITIWNNERPAIIVWLVHEGRYGRQVISLEEGPEYLESLDKRARMRGLALLIPLLDLEDTSVLSASDIWAGFKDPIVKASKRYNADVILTGKLVQVVPALWRMDWTVYIDQEIFNWSSQANLAVTVLREGMDELADRLAARFAKVGSTKTEMIELVISNIHNLDQYARTLTYLESLQSVHSVQVKQVTSDKVMLEIANFGGLPVLDQSIRLGNVLEPAINENDSSYRLLTR